MMHTLWNSQLLLVSPTIRSNRDHFLQADLNEAGRAADASREMIGAVVACPVGI